MVGLDGNITDPIQKQKSQISGYQYKRHLSWVTRPDLKTNNIFHCTFFEKGPPWVLDLPKTLYILSKKWKSQNLITSIKETQPNFRN